MESDGQRLLGTTAMFETSTKHIDSNCFGRFWRGRDVYGWYRRQSWYIWILSWNMIDFYILRNVKNVMFHYMPVVTLNNIGDENVKWKLNFNWSWGWWFYFSEHLFESSWVYSDDVSNFSLCCNFGFKLQVKHCGKCHRNDMASAKTHVFNSSQHLTCQSIHESKHEQIRNHQHHVHFQIFRPTHS